MEETYYKEMCRKLQEMLEQGDFHGKELYLFGCTEATEKMIAFLQEQGIAARAVLDNNMAKQGTCFAGVPVELPSALRKDADSMVLIASRAYEPMAAQLHAMGYPGQVVRVVDYNTFAAYSLAEDVVREKYARMERGRQVFRCLQEEGGGAFLVICPYAALGDVYWAMAYLPYYAERQGIRRYLIVVAGAGCLSVARMFGVPNVAELPRWEMDELVQAVLYDEAESVLIAHHDRPYTNDMTKLIDCGDLRFDELYCCGVYGLPRETKPVLPKHSAEYHGDVLIPENHSLILAPYAKSVIALPGSFWERQVREGMEKGWTVFTNVAGGEEPLPQTVPLRVSIEEFPAAVRRAGHFIGLRSGLCDLLFGVPCDKTAVFPSAYYSVTHRKVADFFALPGWRQIVV